MIVVPNVYQPIGRDLVSGFSPRSFLRRFDASAAATTINSNTATAFRIPADEVVVLTHAFAQGVGGAAQTISRLSIDVFDDNLNPLGRLTQFLLAAGVPSAQAAWQGQLVFFGGSSFNASGIFSAGVAANSVEFTLGGYILPRGNWQR